MTFEGMDAASVRRIVDWLEERSIVYQVNGGWAVDALHGSQTRSHGDVDVFVDVAVVHALIEWLEDLGFAIVEDWRPIRVELRAGVRAVAIHPMEIDAQGDGVQRGFGGDIHVHRERDRAVGVIDGRAVVIACADRLEELRDGYELRPQDFHDLEVVRGLADRGDDVALQVP